MSNMHFKVQERRELWGEKAAEVASYMPGPYYQPSAKISGLNRCFYFTLKSYLPGDILVKVDRAAMANGLETRAPFLDRDLVEFALSLPAALKVNGDQTKALLHHACRDFWPPELRSRSKQGFGAPCDVWLSFPEVRALTERVFANGSHLRNLLPGLHGEQGKAHTYQTWILLTLGLWLERHEVQI
jgi:asparagine synthase (glutamine-hydrolysing)